MPWTLFPIGDELITGAHFYELQVQLNKLRNACGFSSVNTVPSSGERFLKDDWLIALRDGFDRLHSLYGDNLTVAFYQQANGRWQGRSTSWVLTESGGYGSWYSFGRVLAAQLNQLYLALEYAYNNMWYRISHPPMSGYPVYYADYLNVTGPYDSYPVDESTWREARISATSQSNAFASNIITNGPLWGAQFKGSRGAPLALVRLLNTSDTNWKTNTYQSYYDTCGHVFWSHTNLVLNIDITPAVLKSANCQYKATWNYTTNPTVAYKGSLPTTVLLDGSTLCEYVGGGTTEKEWRNFFDCSVSYYDLDFTNDSTITYDISGWGSSYFVPPDIPQNADPWVVTTYYDVGDLVTNESSYWQCITAHTGAYDKEPGHAGSEPYWELVEDFSWYQGDPSTVTQYAWGMPNFDSIIAKPYITGW